MLPILPVNKIQEWDSFTIKNEPIKSIDLMERASSVYANWLSLQIEGTNPKILVVASKGNNGGDGLAVARLLNDKAYDVSIVIADIQPKSSKDFDINLQKIEQKRIGYQTLKSGDTLPNFDDYDLIIDCLFGSGLTRPIEGYWENLVVAINNSKAKVFSIDMPSGMYADRRSDGKVIVCDNCLSFEIPKLAFLMPENSNYIKNWDVKSIGLDGKYLNKVEVKNYYICKNDIKKIIKPKNKFDHKGKNGHALIVGGSKGMAGAAVLSSKAAMRSGVGLVTDKNYAEFIPKSVQDLVTQAEKDVVEGKVTVPTAIGEEKEAGKDKTGLEILRDSLQP